MHIYFIPTTDLKKGIFEWLGSRGKTQIWHKGLYNTSVIVALSYFHTECLIWPWYVIKLKHIKPATLWTKYSHVPIRKYRCSALSFLVLIFNICSALHVDTYVAEAC